MNKKRVLYENVFLNMNECYCFCNDFIKLLWSVNWYIFSELLEAEKCVASGAPLLNFSDSIFRIFLPIIYIDINLSVALDTKMT
jgi:hypothetical protein